MSQKTVLVISSKVLLCVGGDLAMVELFESWAVISAYLVLHLLFVFLGFFFGNKKCISCSHDCRDNAGSSRAEVLLMDRQDAHVNLEIVCKNMFKYSCILFLKSCCKSFINRWCFLDIPLQNLPERTNVSTSLNIHWVPAPRLQTLLLCKGCGKVLLVLIMKSPSGYSQRDVCLRYRRQVSVCCFDLSSWCLPCC